MYTGCLALRPFLSLPRLLPIWQPQDPLSPGSEHSPFFRLPLPFSLSASLPALLALVHAGPTSHPRSPSPRPLSQSCFDSTLDGRPAAAAPLHGVLAVPNPHPLVIYQPTPFSLLFVSFLLLTHTQTQHNIRFNNHASNSYPSSSTSLPLLTPQPPHRSPANMTFTNVTFVAPQTVNSVRGPWDDQDPSRGSRRRGSTTTTTSSPPRRGPRDDQDPQRGPQPRDDQDPFA